MKSHVLRKNNSVVLSVAKQDSYPHGGRLEVPGVVERPTIMELEVSGVFGDLLTIEYLASRAKNWPAKEQNVKLQNEPNRPHPISMPPA